MIINKWAKRLIGLAAILFITESPMSFAALIFSDDFQDGIADGWHASGKGEVRLSKYKENVTLLLTRQANVLTAIPVEGYESLSVSLAFAAASLEKNEYCIAEISIDGGKNWFEILRVGDGQDDSFTLHRGSLTLEKASLDNTEIYIGARVTGDKDNDSCWLDDVRVTGKRQMTEAQRLLLSKPFPETDSISYPAPVNMTRFKPSLEATQSLFNFEGILAFGGKRKSGGFEVLRDTFHLMDDRSVDVDSLPGMSISLVQSGQHLLPVRRGITYTTHPVWDMVIEPGQVWNEPGETGFSRAAMPFSLQEKNKNCTHHGVMSFLFDDAGIASDIAVQISSETCLYFQFDLWGFLAATYTPTPLDTAPDVVADFQREVKSRIPRKPLNDLPDDYPGTDISNFASPSEIDPDYLTTYGLVIDGVHYSGDCETRYGTYPYCDYLDLPSYSTAKSLFAGLALMRLERLYPGIMEEKIADHVPACKASHWKAITLAQTLNMQTGRYASSGYMVDENSLNMARFFNAREHQDKIKLACGLFKQKTSPGRRWVYHTSDTYVLSTAMANFLKQKQGENSDIYTDILVEPVWRTLALSPVTASTLRTLDSRGQPFAGYGLTFLADDVAKLASFLNRDAIKEPDGALLFDLRSLKKALALDPKDAGVPAPGKTLQYRNGFWSTKFNKIPGCSKPLRVPFMSGFGGITIALFPNGISYYYFSDGNDFIWEKALLEANKIKPLGCQ